MKERKTKNLDKIRNIYSKYKEELIRFFLLIVFFTPAFVGGCIAYQLSKGTNLIKFIINIITGWWLGSLIGTLIVLPILIFVENQKSKRNEK